MLEDRAVGGFGSVVGLGGARAVGLLRFVGNGVADETDEDEWVRRRWIGPAVGPDPPRPWNHRCSVSGAEAPTGYHPPSVDSPAARTGPMIASPAPSIRPGQPAYPHCLFVLPGTVPAREPELLNAPRRFMLLLRGLGVITRCSARGQEDEQF